MEEAEIKISISEEYHKNLRRRFQKICEEAKSIPEVRISSISDKSNRRMGSGGAVRLYRSLVLAVTWGALGEPWSQGNPFLDGRRGGLQ